MATKTVNGRTFSEVLNDYLEHRESEPEEFNGYTDKEWYRRGEAVTTELDEFFTESGGVSWRE